MRAQVTQADAQTLSTYMSDFPAGTVTLGAGAFNSFALAVSALLYADVARCCAAQGLCLSI
jgi:hypothetical protein